MIYFYLVLSAALIPILNNFWEILRKPYSFWLVPVLFIGFFLGFIILQIGLLAVSILLVNPKTESEKGNKYYRFMVNISLPLIFKLARVKINVTGAEKIPENKRVMLVCNHINDVDPAVIMSGLKGLDLGFIAKKEVYTLFPFVAKMMKKLYCLPIDRENNREGVKTIIRAIDYIKKDKVSIGIFPEGYTSLDGELHEFRNGAFKIATKSKCPIVVCTLVNSNLVFKNMFKRKTEVYLDVLEVISEEETAVLHTDILGARVHETMLKNLEMRKNK
ncbi:MAG: 1-acyl-sn-glycerol-3-phosphate acyltransferase [Clostridia bacterium]|nr:1-acyl-sn-glycerol-3-phosphate acyltransferase [Clostridia bacterium]